MGEKKNMEKKNLFSVVRSHFILLNVFSAPEYCRNRFWPI